MNRPKNGLEMNEYGHWLLSQGFSLAADYWFKEARFWWWYGK